MHRERTTRVERSTYGERTMPVERSMPTERTILRERSTRTERTISHERSTYPERTISRERTNMKIELSQSPLAVYWRKRQADYSSKPADSPKLKSDNRICLRCRKIFLSSWVGNRMCGRCIAAGNGVCKGGL